MNLDYIQSFACTKYVKTKGSVTQNHSGRKIKKATHANTESPNNPQYFPKFFASAIIRYLT